MTTMRALLTIVHLTLHEAMRRRILLAALICGAAFLALYATGVHFIVRDFDHNARVTLVERRMILNFFSLAGLYAVNFLVIMTAVLLPVDTLSGEISSGVIQTVAAKPIARGTIVLGKWCAYVLLVAGYLLLLAGGVLAIVRLRAGFTLPGPEAGLPLMMLEGAILVSLVIAGGTRLSTVTNGVMVFGLYGLAFIGGWVEQIGAIAGNEAARDVGTVASLIMPTEALWQLAASRMQPVMMRELHMTPFSPASVPSAAMVWWAAGYGLTALLVALRLFRKRPL